MFWVVLFPNVSSAMKAEKILKEEGIGCKLIPVPKHISSDCGVCLRIEESAVPRVREVLSGKVSVLDFRKL